jgi:hypothetical protein
MDVACVNHITTVRQHSISQVDGTPEQMFDSRSQGVGGDPSSQPGKVPPGRRLYLAEGSNFPVLPDLVPMFD